jgi:hypothetical protein
MRLSLLALTGMLAAGVASAQNGFSGPGLYEIMNQKSTRMMALDTRDRSSVIQIVSRSQEEQRWIVEPGLNGTFFIRSAIHGRALQITNNARSTPVVCSRFDGSPAQQWRIEPGKDGNPLIVSAVGGRVLDIPNGSNQEGLRIQIYDRDGDSNQRFVFHRIDERREKDRERRDRWDRDERDRR